MGIIQFCFDISCVFNMSLEVSLLWYSPENKECEKFLSQAIVHHEWKQTLAQKVFENNSERNQWKLNYLPIF